MVSCLLSGQGPASSLNCPVIPVLEYLSTRNEFKLFALGVHLSPASLPVEDSFSVSSLKPNTVNILLACFSLGY